MPAGACPVWWTDSHYQLLGTTADTIDEMEDRDRFYQFLEIDRILGQEVSNEEELTAIVKELGYPLMIRPSYVIGGKGMHRLKTATDLEKLLPEMVFPILVDAYIDCISDKTTTYEQIEAAGPR
ncbi:hypothetical protein [Exiguobacterium antarcticum]|uniref:ATP-binding protein n=1 Tax=Exiguobacterium antarcticum TaxID=132920 RepID=UPI0006862E66|nr:hypothetical protein [Exiguobacterium antarcticum]